MHADRDARDAWASSLPFREQAVACAWRDLCGAAGSGQVAALDVAREIAAPVGNLAAALATLQPGGSAPNGSCGARCAATRARASTSNMAKLCKPAVARRWRCAPASARFPSRRRSPIHHCYYAYAAETQAAIAANRFRRSEVATVFGPGFDPYRAALAAPSEVDAGTLATLRRACRGMGREDRLTALSFLSQTLHALKPRPSEADPARRARLRRAARDYPRVRRTPKSPRSSGGRRRRSRSRSGVSICRTSRPRARSVAQSGSCASA